MGLNDAYPFVLTQPVRTKLSFIHHAIHDRLDRMPALVEKKSKAKAKVKSKPKAKSRKPKHKT